MPRPAPRAMTSVWSTWIAELKNSIQKPGASPRTRRRLPAQPRPPFNVLLKAAVFSWASSGLVVGLVRLVATPPYNVTAQFNMALMKIVKADIINKIIPMKWGVSRMQITKIRVKNFKSFKDETITLNRLNILIGSNAAGKSNTVSIIAFLNDIIEFGLDNAISLSGGLEYVLNTSLPKSIPLEISISCFCEDDNWISTKPQDKSNRLIMSKFDCTFEITPHKRGSGYSVTKDTLTLYFYQFVKSTLPNEPNHRDVDYSHEYILEYRKSKKKVMLDWKINGPDFNKQDLDDATGSSFIAKLISGLPNKNEVLFRYISFFSPFIASTVPLARIYDFDPKMMKKAATMTSVTHLEENGENLANILNALLKSKANRERLKDLLNDFLPFIDNISTESNFDKSVSYKIKENYSSKPLYANFLSDGTVSILAIIIALNFESGSDIIILEEPERNLHPYLMDRLMEMARETSKQKQILITTHTPELIKHASIEDVLFANRDVNGFSRIMRLSDSETVKQFLQDEIGIDCLYVNNLLGD